MGNKSNYSLEVKDLETNESILEIKPVESGINAFIHALFAKKQINQQLCPFINLTQCNKGPIVFGMSEDPKEFYIMSPRIEALLMEADKQEDDKLIREEIIKTIIQMDAPAKLKRVVTQSVNKTNDEWIINLNSNESIWFNNNDSMCYGAQNQCKIVKEYFGFGTISRYYIMPCLEIKDFSKETRDIYYYKNPTSDRLKYYDKSKDVIIPGQEEVVEKINSKLSSLKFFVRDGETEFCNQQYNNDYEPKVRDGLRGFLKTIMTREVPKKFKTLRDICVDLEQKQIQIEKAKAKEAREAMPVKGQSHNIGSTIIQRSAYEESPNAE